MFISSIHMVYNAKMIFWCEDNEIKKQLNATAIQYLYNAFVFSVLWPYVITVNWCVKSKAGILYPFVTNVVKFGERRVFIPCWENVIDSREFESGEWKPESTHYLGSGLL